MEVDLNEAALLILAALTVTSAFLIALAVLILARRDTSPRPMVRPYCRVTLAHRFMSLLGRMAEKGSLTLSIDKALWAIVGIIVAFNSPAAFAAAVQFVQGLR